MANRMFMGYRIGRNAVRGSFELSHFVEEGTHSMGDETKCFWAGPTITAEDLRRFIEDDTVYRFIWGAMEEYEQTYKFGRLRVVWPSFRMWPRRLAELLGFPKVAAAIAELEVKEHEKRQQAEAEFKVAITERALLRRHSQ
jgi:predicted HAD superfamily phosphohydrolase